MAARTRAEGGFFYRGTSQLAHLDEGQYRRRTRYHPRVLRLHPLRRARRHRQGDPSLRRPPRPANGRTNGGPRRMSDLPTDWEWAELSEVCTSIPDGDPQPPPQTSSGVPFLVIGNIRN